MPENKIIVGIKYINSSGDKIVTIKRESDSLPSLEIKKEELNSLIRLLTVAEIKIEEKK